MRIVHLVSTFPPYFGGMGNAVFAMAQESARRGHEVTVLTPKVKSRKSKVESLDNNFPFTIRRLFPVLRYGNAAFLPQLFWMLDDYDIVHLHYPFFGGAEVVALWRMSQTRRSKRRLVITYHMDAIAEGLLGKIFAWHNRFCLPWILDAADRIIVTSFDYAEHSLVNSQGTSRPGSRNNIFEIPLAVDTERFYPREKEVELLQRHKIDPAAFVILFVGALDRAHRFKGVEVLLRAFKLLCEFRGAEIIFPRLVIVGDGVLRPSYAALARELGVQEHIVFTGRISNNDLPRYYNLADCVALPSVSQSEAFGMTLLEGMASGKPVIASNLPGVRKLVVDKRTGILVKTGDVVGLAKAIESFASDPELCVKYGQAGRARAEERYQWGAIGEELERIYTCMTCMK